MSDKLYVIAGPSGVGKGTIVSELRKCYPQIFVSISMTTRPPRDGEVEGKHYFFVTKQVFEQMINNNQILEYAFVHGQNYYGTPLQPIQKAIDEGKPCLLEIDLDGVRQVKKIMGEKVCCIFIAPPSWEELSRRLINRGSESADNIAQRLRTAKVELQAQEEFDHVVVNDDLEVAVSEVASIMHLL